MRMNSDPAFRLMNSRSAWGIYEKTFSLNRNIKYRIYTYIYEENLSRYLGKHVIVRQYRDRTKNCSSRGCVLVAIVYRHVTVPTKFERFAPMAIMHHLSREGIFSLIVVLVPGHTNHISNLSYPNTTYTEQL